MEYIGTLTSIIDEQRDAIDILSREIDALKLKQLQPTDMMWYGNKMSDMDRDELLEMNTYLFKMLCEFNPDIRKIGRAHV